MKKEKYGFTNPVGPLSVKDNDISDNDVYKDFAYLGSAEPRSPNSVGRSPEKRVSVKDIRVQDSDSLRVGNPVRGALVNEDYNTYNVLPAS